jgi:hypothetical protein
MGDYPGHNLPNGLMPITAAELADDDDFIIGDQSEDPPGLVKGLSKSEHSKLFLLPFLRGVIVRPVLENYEWVNQETATVEDSIYGLHLSSIGATNSNHLLVKSLSGINAVTICIIPTYMYATTSYFYAGVLLRKSSDGHMLLIGLQKTGTYISIETWSSPTSKASTLGSPSLLQSHTDLLWLRLRKNEVYYYIDYSADGYHWLNIYTYAINSFLTADQYGIFVNNGITNNPCAATFFSIQET